MAEIAVTVEIRRGGRNQRVQEKVYAFLRHGHHYAIEDVDQVAAGLSGITSRSAKSGIIDRNSGTLRSVSAICSSGRKPRSIHNSVSATVTSGLSFSSLVVPIRQPAGRFLLHSRGRDLLRLLFVS